MPDRERAAIDRMRSPARLAMPNRSAPEPRFDRLRQRHHAVPASREQRDRLVGSRVRFCTYVMPNRTLDSHAPMVAARA
jgi:hypothetical protein